MLDARAVSASEVEKARSFLEDRLLPDLEQAKRLEAGVREESRNCERLLVHLRELADKKRSGIEDAQAEVDLDANLTVGAQYSTSVDPIISLGKADLYIQMPAWEARAVISQRLKLLSKKQDREAEKVARIEAIVHLSSTTLAKLDALRSGDTSTVVNI